MTSVVYYSNCLIALLLNKEVIEIYSYDRRVHEAATDKPQFQGVFRNCIKIKSSIAIQSAKLVRLTENKLHGTQLI